MQILNEMSPPVLIAALLLGLTALSANLISYVMIWKINKRVPQNEQISYWWWGSEVQRKFKQHYPSHKLTHLLRGCIVIMVLCFLFLIRFWVFG